jgi:hypothetical protein
MRVRQSRVTFRVVVAFGARRARGNRVQVPSGAHSVRAVRRPRRVPGFAARPTALRAPAHAAGINVAGRGRPISRARSRPFLGNPSRRQSMPLA